MRLTVLSPSRQLVSQVEVDEIFAPGFRGELNILPEHANFVTELETGILRWKERGGAQKSCTMTTGFLEVYEGNITVLSQVSELPQEIDLVRAKKAEEKARAKLDEGLDDDNYRKHELKLRRALMRQMLGG